MVDDTLRIQLCMQHHDKRWVGFYPLLLRSIAKNTNNNNTNTDAIAKA